MAVRPCLKNWMSGLCKQPEVKRVFKTSYYSYYNGNHFADDSIFRAIQALAANYRAYGPSIWPGGGWPGAAGKPLPFPADYRFHSAMTGTLGLGDDLNRYTPAKEQEVAGLVWEYKAIRPIVQEGDLYRLVSPRSGSLAALEYVTLDRTAAVVFVFRHTDHYWQAATRVRLCGLAPLRRYRIEGLKEGQEIIASGQSLTSLGILPELGGHFASALIKLTSV